MDIGLEWIAPSNADSTASWLRAHAEMAHLPTVRHSVTMRATPDGARHTLDACRALHQTGHRAGLMAHATTGVLERRRFAAWMDSLRPTGVDALLCMRGDTVVAADPFASVLDLVRATANTGWAQPWVAASPDGHPDSRGEQADFDWLLAKIDAGAVGAITQALFDATRFLRWRDRLAVARPGFLWVAGVVPVREWARTARFAQRCGVPLPHALERRLAGLSPAEATTQGRLHTENLVAQLDRAGCDGVHVFTLNASQGIVGLLGGVLETACVAA